jgi:deoxyribonuclease-4
MFRIGAHVSSAGNVANAIERETDIGGNCGQIFVGSPRTWSVSEYDTDEASAFQTASEDADVGPWIVHGTYLINFATPKDDLAEKSVTTVQGEIDACDALDIPYYVFHPGSHTGAGRETGMANVGERLSRLNVPDDVIVLLENTAGKGTTLGTTPAELETMIDHAEQGYDDLGVCLDSCHLYAAGYDITDADELEALLADLEDGPGLEHVHYLHLNDSKHPLGSEKDEHQHIGEGEIGPDGFENLINHPDLRDLPMVLETPVDDDRGYEWNLDRIRELRTDA